MKHARKILTALCCLFMYGQPAFSDQTVIHSITAHQIQSVLGDLGFTGSEVDGDGDVIVMMQGRPAVVIIGSGNGRQIQIVAAFLEPRLSLEQINEWNRNRILSKAYLDRDGDAIFESDLDLDGGVTMARVRDWLQTFSASMGVFMREVIQGGGVRPQERPSRPGDLNVQGGPFRLAPGVSAGYGVDSTARDSAPPPRVPAADS